MNETFDPPSREQLKERERFNAMPPEKRAEEILRLQERAMLENITTFYEDEAAADSPEMKEQLKLAADVAAAVKDAGGLALVVGGYARDKALGKFGYKLASKDIDIEVYGLDIERLLEVLGRFGKIDTVGEQFCVIKLKGLDISIPRKDSKTGQGHRDFRIEGDPNMTVHEAARRRDFTVNAMAIDPLTGELIDPWGGLDDMARRELRATDKERFGDDALRVLRAMQFAGRFGFTVEEGTAELCRNTDLSHLPKERIGEEWVKFLLKSPKPSCGLRVAKELGIIEKLHPEVAALIGVEQDSKHHPEGDVWTHTAMTLDEAAALCAERRLPKKEALVITLGALCHDLGKPATTRRNEEERLISYGHEKAGIEPARKFLDGLSISGDIKQKVLKLAEHHMFPLMNPNAGPAAVKNLARDLSPASIQELYYVGYADKKGSAEEWNGYPQGDNMLKKAEELAVKESRPLPLLQGRHLIALGMKPGVRFGEITRELYRMQLDDKIHTQKEAENLAVLLNFLYDVERTEMAGVKLLNGEMLTKMEMIEFLKERFLNQKTHDMGTLVMSMMLAGEELPEALERNRLAILTAHKFGPVWFSRLERDFYEHAWKSFYGRFEVDEERRDELEEMPFTEQKEEALRLVKQPDARNIERYDETLNIKPMEQDGIFARYETSQYPFEAGMFDGYRVMVQYNPERRHLSVSVLDEDPEKVKELDAQIRKSLPEFAHAKKIGYLYASDESGADDVFAPQDAKRAYDALRESLKFEK